MSTATISQRQLNEINIGFKTKQLKNNNLFFADDMVLIAETKEDTEISIDKLREAERNVELK